MTNRFSKSRYSRIGIVWARDRPAGSAKFADWPDRRDELDIGVRATRGARDGLGRSEGRGFRSGSCRGPCSAFRSDLGSVLCSGGALRRGFDRLGYGERVRLLLRPLRCRREGVASRSGSQRGPNVPKLNLKLLGNCTQSLEPSRRRKDAYWLQRNETMESKQWPG